MQKDFRDSELYEGHYRFKERASNRNFFLALFLIAVLFIGGRLYWVQNFGGVVVDGSSMYRTLDSGEQLLVRYTGDGFKAKRGDIIVVYVEHYPEVQEINAGRKEENKLKYLIKRLIAVEGDTVKCVEGQMYLKKQGEQDFTCIEEPYAHYIGKDKKEYNFAEYELKEGDIFFLGDNRFHSKDSRWKEGESNLDTFYKEEDIFGVVPEWAVKYRATLEKIFFNDFQIKSK